MVVEKQLLIGLLDPAWGYFFCISVPVGLFHIHWKHLWREGFALRGISTVLERDNNGQLFKNDLCWSLVPKFNFSSLQNLLRGQL